MGKKRTFNSSFQQSTIQQALELAGMGYQVVKRAKKVLETAPRAKGKRPITQTRTKVSEKKYKKSGQVELHQGWYVDTIWGQIEKRSAQSREALSTVGRTLGYTIKPYTLDTVQNRWSAMTTILNMWDLTQLQTARGIYDNIAFYIGPSHGKIIFTNCSTWKILYEFYAVRPVQAQSVTFASAYAQNYQQWSAGNPQIEPEACPEEVLWYGLKKQYKILGKSVFRLNPGEVGELHWKAKTERRFESLQGKRTYENENFQIAVRCIGMTAGYLDITVPAAPVWIEAAAGLGRTGQHTAFTVSEQNSWWRANIDNPNTLVYSNLLNGETGTSKPAVVHEDQAYEGKEPIED